MGMKQFKFWDGLSLRGRLSFLLSAMFLGALIAGFVLLSLFSEGQLVDESEPAARSASHVAQALNNAIIASKDPQATLAAFAQTLDAFGSEALTFLPLGSGPKPPIARSERHNVPAWFVALLDTPPMIERHPILVDGIHAGDLIFDPDNSADIYEKWVGFLAIATAGISLSILTVIIAYFTIGATLGPLRNLTTGLTRLRAGNYATAIVPCGPPEVRHSGEQLNELAMTLGELSQENRRLLRKMISVQDRERKELARELHDELGPLLFAIRANATAMADDASSADGPPASIMQILQSAEALQHTNRRILDRLRPLYIEELGLDASIKTLIRNAHSLRPNLRVMTRIDPDVTTIDSVVSQTIFRVIQEGVTNVLRHADASELDIRAFVGDDHVSVEISDNGLGPAAETVFGRGLTGMRERAQALGGDFQFMRDGDWTRVRCKLPTIAGV